MDPKTIDPKSKWGRRAAGILNSNEIRREGGIFKFG
jgi:hypothetical protein